MADLAFTDAPDNPAYFSVEDCIMDARTLLQDTVVPYRYDDNSLLTALSAMMLEARRLRPDLFLYTENYRYSPPSFTAVDDTIIEIEDKFRHAFVYGIVSHALARDQEDVQDERATTMLQNFTAILTGQTLTPIQGGGTPGGGKT